MFFSKTETEKSSVFAFFVRTARWQTKNATAKKERPQRNVCSA
jgi:hypothetical protein